MTSVFPHGPVFRPTATQTFSRCPTKYYLEHVEGWEAPLGTWSPERDIGTALHAGMAAYWKPWSDPFAAAVIRLGELWPGDQLDGGEYSFEGMCDLVGKAMGKIVKWFGTDLAGAKLVMSEQPLGADGHTTPDLVTREHGDLVVTDLKYHHYVAADRISYRFENIERDHQFNHYPWAVSEYLGEPVRRFRKLGVIGLPKLVVRAEMFEITEAGQRVWLQGARRMWHEMDRLGKSGGREFLYRRVEGCRPYGEKYPCPMEAACWECHLDPEQMAKFYTRRSDTRKESI